MQGEFEKRVQEKMAELNLTPAAPVWEKIARQIKPEKKRPRVVFWLFFAGLLATGGWWLLWQPEPLGNQTMNENRPAAAVQNTTPASVTKQATTTQKGIVGETHAGPIAQNLPLGKKVNQQATQKRIAEGGFVSSVKTTEQKPAPTAFSPDRNSFAPPEETVSSGVNAQTKTAEHTTVSATAETANTKTDIPVNTDSTQANPQASNETEKPVAADSISRKQKVASLDKKWQKRILLSAGWSQYSSGITTAFQDRYALSSPVANNGGSYIGSPQPVLYTKGLAFSVGAGLSRSVTGRLTLTAALQYSYYSVNSKVGNYRRIDTAIVYLGDRLAVGGYYDKSQTRDYTTSFHVLELPLGIEYRLFNHLRVSAGASYGRLLTSNALTNNAATNFYYYNKDNNATSYVNLFAGLQYRLVKKGGWKLDAGPQLQYNTSRLQEQTVDEQPHLFSAGLKTVVSF